VRTLDARTDEFRNMKGGENEPKEDNPMLGWHGVRRDLDEPELFRAQIGAFKQLHAAGHTNVAIMLPFIINVEELRKARELAREFGLPETCKFGIMVETPAAAINIEEFCKEGIDFISFGSNDLTQLTLGLDRNNERLIKLFDEMHPAMQFLFKHAISACKRYGVTTSICGELPSNREDAVRFLKEAGIDSMSVNIDAIDKVRGWLARM
jgi:pyruvate,water dikinase